MTNATSPQIVFTCDKTRIHRVQYLETAYFDLGIESQNPSRRVIIDSLALRFASRRGQSSTLKSEAQTSVVFTGGPIVLNPKERTHRTLSVHPNLLFFKGSNYFDVAFTYREDGADLKHPQSMVVPVWFLLIDQAPPYYGKVFISYKEAEDRSLAERLKEFCRDAGFDPYIAPADVKLGSDIWDKKIPEEIKKSKFIFVVWTNNSAKGPGVKREIKIAKKNGVQIAALLAKKTKNPGLFGRNKEYLRFDRRDPDGEFAAAVAGRRAM